MLYCGYMGLPLFFKLAGAAGLLLISYGVLVKSERRQDEIFILGSAGLLAYSLFLRDPIFVPLQVVFMLVSAMELVKKRKKRKG